MKALIIMSGLTVGIFMGLYPSINKPKPLIWKLFAALLMTGLIFLALLPPTAASLYEADFISANTGKFEGKIYVSFDIPDQINEKENKILIVARDAKNESRKTQVAFSDENLPEEIKAGNRLIINTKYNTEEKYFEYISTEYVNPIITLPYIIQFEERIRIMNFHVPVAWVSVLAYLISMIYSIQYLKHRNLEYDIKASSAASLGTIFCILATVTGMIWAKFNWGAFWNWDPRQTSIFILLLIYGAYFALRSAISGVEQRARLSSAYSILAFITVPFFIFVIPRITAGLHPGSGEEETIGPVLSSQSEMLNATMQYTFGLGLAAFTIIFFWMYNLTVRYRKLENRL